MSDNQPNGRLVDLREVVKTYQSSAGTFTALKGVDLQVESGAFVSIIGKSGSGKSTLINVITGIDRPTSGEVIVDDIRIHTLERGADCRLARPLDRRDLPILPASAHSDCR